MEQIFPTGHIGEDSTLDARGKLLVDKKHQNFGTDEMQYAASSSADVNNNNETDNDDGYSDDDDQINEAESNNGRWTKTEHEMFLRGMSLWGRDWKKVQSAVKVRSANKLVFAYLNLCLLLFNILVFLRRVTNNRS